jgi:hypothetical protein
MKKNNVRAIIKSRKFLGSCVALAIAAVIGGNVFFQSAEKVDFPEFTDPIMEQEIEQEDTALSSAPKVTTKTSKKTSKKNVNISKASAKTYKKTLPTTKKTTTKRTSTSSTAVTTQTTVTTATTEQYTKKSKVKVVTTTVTTTVKTTTVAVATPTPTPKTYQKYTAAVNTIAPKMDSRVRSAFETLGFTITVDPDVVYSGYFNARNQAITLNAKQQAVYSDTVYHELGHFLAFIAGNVDTKAEFTAIYNEEKSKMTGTSATYAKQSSSEFFAECVKLYTTSPATLKSTCPKSYAAVAAAFEKVTDERVAAIKKAYAAYWK